MVCCWLPLKCKAILSVLGGVVLTVKGKTFTRWLLSKLIPCVCRCSCIFWALLPGIMDQKQIKIGFLPGIMFLKQKLPWTQSPPPRGSVVKKTTNPPGGARQGENRGFYGIRIECKLIPVFDNTETHALSLGPRENKNAGHDRHGTRPKTPTMEVNPMVDTIYGRQFAAGLEFKPGSVKGESRSDTCYGTSEHPPGGRCTLFSGCC